MLHFIFDTVFGWVGVAGLVVIACIVVGYFIPGLRLIALEVAGGVLAAASIYAKGSHDRAVLENQRKEEAVKRAREAYAKIEARPDTPGTVSKRLGSGTL